MTIVKIKIQTDRFRRKGTRWMSSLSWIFTHMLTLNNGKSILMCGYLHRRYPHVGTDEMGFISFKVNGWANIKKNPSDPFKELT